MEYGGGEETVYLSLHCHHQDDDESHSNVALFVKDKVTTRLSTNHNLSEEKGQSKRNRAEATLL